MITHFKATALIAAVALVLAMPLAAQTIPNLPGSPAGFSSNTSTATAGVFGTDVDDSMDVHWYTGVEFPKGFAYIGYGGSATYNPIALGYATRFGNLYLGTRYIGNIINSDGTQTVSVDQTYTLEDQLRTEKKTTTTYSSFMTYSNNQIEALIGVAGMGIKVGFWESLYSSENPNRTVTITEDLSGREYQGEIAEYVNFGGHLRPALEWGMTIGAGALEIRPKIGAALDIYQRKYLLKTKNDYTKLFGTSTIEQPDITYTAGHNYGYLAPEVTVGAGIGLPSAEGSSTSSSLDFSYTLGMRIYSNDYDVAGASGTAAGTVSWTSASTTYANTIDTKTTTNTATLEFDNQSAMSHGIWLGFWHENKLTENFSLGLYTGVGVDIGVEDSDEYDYTRTVTKVNHLYKNTGVDTTTTTEATGPNRVTNITTLNVAPILNVAAKYELLPGRFSINAGISMDPIAFTNTVTKRTVASERTTTKTTTVDDKGKVVSKTETVDTATDDTTTDSVISRNTWDHFTAGLNGGFVFNFNDSAALDLAVSSSRSFWVDIAYVSVLFTLKF